MKKLFMLCCLASTFSMIEAKDIQKYFGASSTEATLTFEAMIDMDQREDVDQQIDEQLQYLIGHFSSESFKKKYGLPGVAGDTYDVKITSRKKQGGRLLVGYKYEGKVNFHVDAFKKSRTVSVPIRLPLALDKFFRLGLVNGVNRCTDPHYNSEGDLFYFWDVEKKGCPLKNNHRDVLHLKGRLTRLDNTRSTYPEYHELYNKEELKVSVFIGYIDDEPSKYDPAVEQYHDIKKYLMKFGYTLAKEWRRFGPLSDDEGKGLNYRAIYEKERRNALGKTQTVKVHVLVADTAIDSEDATFQKGYEKAIANDDLVVYDGHSGLGANIGADYLPNLQFRANYQVLFLNGCSSYPYFNREYFDKKPGGSKNLEIITSGLSTYSTTATANMLAFLKPFLKGSLLSYQSLLGDIERSNGDEDTYLTGVNGDNDNRFRPGN